MGSFSYHVGQRIKKYRKSRGYTIEQFSAMINKSKATVSKYENGTITIDVETLYDVARALDIDLKCFIDYQPPVFHAQSVLPKNFYFNQPRAYMYYYDGRVRQLVRSLLCFSPSASGEGIDVMMYVGVDNFREPDRCQHLFISRGSRHRRTRIRPRCGRRSICYSISSRLDEAGTSFCFGSVTRRTPSAYAALMPAASMPEISKLLA